MATFIVENEYNIQLQLTQNERQWQLISVTGLNPAPANVVTSVIPNVDGSRFNSSRLEQRNIVLTLVINGNAEENRNALNSVIFAKRYLKIYYSNNSKNVYIEGYVESIEYDVFSEKLQVQISVICPSPFWKDINQTITEITPIANLFEFPFSIPQEGIAFSELIGNAQGIVNNSGTVQTGIIINIESTHKVLNPSITNLTTGETMKVDVELSQTDLLTISTLKGNKNIKMYSNGVVNNVINNLEPQSKWISLITGQNTFTYSADYGVENMRINIISRNQYGGV